MKPTPIIAATVTVVLMAQLLFLLIYTLISLQAELRSYDERLENLETIVTALSKSPPIPVKPTGKAGALEN